MTITIKNGKKEVIGQVRGVKTVKGAGLILQDWKDEFGDKCYGVLSA